MSISPLRIKCSTDSRQGGRLYMEDMLCVNETVSGNSNLYSGPAFSYFAIFDGHGGAAAAEFAKEHLLEEIISQPGFSSDDDAVVMNAITEGFLSTHKRTWNELASWPKTASGRPSNAGTTASIVILRRNKLYVAHVGDSTVVLGCRSEQESDSQVFSRCLTKDHKPEEKDERKRIESSGGLVLVKAGVPRVVWKRPKQLEGPVRRSTQVDIIPFLAIARSLGDLWSYSPETDTYHVSPVPDVSVMEINVTRHKHLILASDGLWNVVTPDESVKVVNHLQNKKHSPAAVLVRLALERWAKKGQRADNTSVIVVSFLSDADVADVSLECGEGIAAPDGFTPLSPVRGTPLSPLRMSNCNTISSPDKRLHVSLPLSKDFEATSFSCCRPIFKTRGENRRREAVNRRRTLAAAMTIGSERKLFKIPVTPEQRSAYSTQRPSWKGF